MFGFVVLTVYLLFIIDSWIYLFAKLGVKGALQMFKDWLDDDPWVIVSDDIQKNGIVALKEALGVTGALKFLEQFDHGVYR